MGARTALGLPYIKECVTGFPAMAGLAHVFRTAGESGRGLRLQSSGQPFFHGIALLVSAFIVGCLPLALCGQDTQKVLPVATEPAFGTRMTVAINGTISEDTTAHAVTRLPAVIEILYESQVALAAVTPDLKLNDAGLPPEQILWRPLPSGKGLLRVVLTDQDTGILTAALLPVSRTTVAPLLTFRVMPPVITTSDTITLRQGGASIRFRRPLLPGTYTVQLRGYSTGPEPVSLSIAPSVKDHISSVLLPTRNAAEGTPCADREGRIPEFPVDTPGLYEVTIQLEGPTPAVITRVSLMHKETERTMSIAPASFYLAE